MNEEQQILIDNYKRLPADLQQAVLLIVQNGRLSQVLTQYKIPKEQLEAITEETLLILLGIEHVSNYKLNLMSVPDLESGLASMIAEQIHTKIFRSINESLEKIGEIQKTLMEGVGQYADEKTVNSGVEKERRVIDTPKMSMPQAKRSYTPAWFVSRERQDVADQLRGKLEKTERLIMLVRNSNGPANDQQPQAPN